MLISRTVREYYINEDGYNAEQDNFVIASCESVFVSPGKVTGIESNRRTGINRHSRKRWYRWETTAVKSVFETKTGQIAGRQKSGKKFMPLLVVTQVEHNALFQRSSYFADTLAAEFGELTFDRVYPLARHYGYDREAEMGFGIMPLMRFNDAKPLAEHLFGKTRVRRDVIKAVAKAKPEFLPVANAFRGLVPIDWIVTFLRNHEREENPAANVNIPTFGTYGLRKHILGLDPRSHRALLNSTLGRADIQAIHDLRKVDVNVSRGMRAATFHDLETAMNERLYPHRRHVHGAVRNPTPYVAPVRTEKAIPVTDLGASVAKIEVPGYRVVLPATNIVLDGWSDQMGNCIRGYDYYVLRDNSDTVLAGIYEGDSLIANVEIRGKRLNQFLGKFNRTMPDVAVKFEPHFAALGIDVTNYLGKSDNKW